MDGVGAASDGNSTEPRPSSEPNSLVDMLLGLAAVPGLVEVLDERSRGWRMDRASFADDLADEP